MITIGIDAHKRSHTATAVDTAEQVIDQLKVAADGEQIGRLLGWAGRWTQRRWAVEGATGTGRLLAQQLIAAGEVVVDVPATLAARVRLLDGGSGRKTDDIDSRATAVAAIRRRDLRPAQREDFAQVLRLLVDERDRLTSQRTRTVNRLHRHLADLVPGGAGRRLSAARAGQLLRGHTPTTQVELERKLIAGQLLDEIARLDVALADNRRRIGEVVRACRTGLTTLFGVGEITAAILIAHTGDPTRFPDQGHYASYNASAPIEASSGDLRRHRHNRRGNRQLNRALHIIAIAQIRHDTAGRAYYRKKLAEHKTQREALRALKRQLSNSVYRTLVHDHQTGKMPRLPDAA